VVLSNGTLLSDKSATTPQWSTHDRSSTPDHTSMTSTQVMSPDGLSPSLNTDLSSQNNLQLHSPPPGLVMMFLSIRLLDVNHTTLSVALAPPQPAVETSTRGTDVWTNFAKTPVVVLSKNGRDAVHRGTTLHTLGSQFHRVDDDKRNWTACVNIHVLYLHCTNTLVFLRALVSSPGLDDWLQ